METPILQPSVKVRETIIFTIGRMNPPTSGHMKLIQALLHKADDMREKIVYIVLSSTDDPGKKQTDPLPCEIKKQILETYVIPTAKKTINPPLKYGDIQVEVLCMKANTDVPECEDDDKKKIKINTTFKQICKIMKTQPTATNLMLLLGTDQYNDATKNREIIDKKTGEKKITDPGGLFFLTKMVELHKSHKLNFEEIKRIIPDKDNPSLATDISASKVRAYVTNDQVDEFIQEMEKIGMPDEEITKLFDYLKIILVPPSSIAEKRKAEEEPAPSKKTKQTKKTKKTKIGGRKKERKTRGRKTRGRKTRGRKTRQR